MVINYDIDKLQNTLKHLYNITGINMRFIMDDYTLLPSMGDDNKYCSIAKNAPDGDRRCRHSDRDLIKRTNWIKDKNGKMTKEKVSHIENEKGKKFYSLLIMNKNDFLEGRKFDFLDIYEMTKSDLTDELTVRLYTKEDVIEIKLKKVN